MNLYSILLTQGFSTIVDKDDYLRYAKYCWCYADGYALRKQKINGKMKTIRLHRIIMGNPKNKIIDHINSDTLDNRKCNLRICSHVENNQNAKRRKDNKSGYKGISWYKKYGKWRVRINSNNEAVFVGFFDNLIDAIEARKQAAETYFGKQGIAL